MGSDEEAVAAVVAARTQALVAADADRMREILAPGFTYTNASGVSCDRDDYIGAYVGSSELVWDSQEAHGTEVHVYGDAAVVVLDVHDRMTYQGQPVEGDFRSLFVYVRHGTTWRCVAGQTTALT